MCLAFMGVAVFVWEKVQTGFQTASLGDLISLSAALGFAIYTMTNKQLLARHSQVAVMTYTLTIGAISALVVSLPTLPTQDWSRITLLGWGALAWTVVVGGYLAWTLWNWVLAHLEVTRAAVFLYLVPVVSGLFSWYLLGEGFGLLKVVGALVVLSGLALARRARAEDRGSQCIVPPKEHAAGITASCIRHFTRFPRRLMHAFGGARS